MVFKNAFLPCKQAHALSPSEQIFAPLFFAQWVSLDLKTNWEQKNGEDLCLDMHFCTHVTILS